MSNHTPTSPPAPAGHGGRRFRTWHSGLALIAIGACLVVAGSLRTTSSTVTPVTEPAATEPAATEPDVTDTVITTPSTEPGTTTPQATTTTAAPAVVTTTSQVGVLPVVSSTIPAAVKPATLPSSGSASTPLIAFGVAFIAVGLTLVVVSRARERRAIS